MTEVSAQELTRTVDCAAPGCPHAAEPGTTRCYRHPADSAAVLEEKEVRRAEADLETLAATARDAHRASGAALASAIQHGIRCGEALIGARPLVDAGPFTWTDWLDRNVGLSLDWASRYIRLAACKTDLPAAAYETWIDRRGRHRDPTITHALGFLTGLPPGENHWSRRRIDGPKRDAVLASLAGGATIAAAAKAHDLSPTTVKRLRDPEWQESGRGALNASKREERRAANVEKEAAARAKLDAGCEVAPQVLLDAYDQMAAAVEAVAATGTCPEALRYARTSLRYLERAIADLAPS